MGDLFWLKWGVLAFWTLWFGLVTLTNLLDALKTAGALPQGWSLASGNLASLRAAVSVHGLGRRSAGFLFAGVIVWQAGCCALLARAAYRSVSHQVLDMAAINLAFAAALGLWAAFMLAEEIFLQYERLDFHLLLWGTQLLSLAALHLLP